MGPFNPLTVRQICNGARHPHDAMIAPRCEAKLFRNFKQERLTFRIRRGVFLQ
jgi:hypothetical protein